jgi:hypothetical protein
MHETLTLFTVAGRVRAAWADDVQIRWKTSTWSCAVSRQFNSDLATRDDNIDYTGGFGRP